MTLSPELQAFAKAVQAAMAEGNHFDTPEVWLDSVDLHYTANVPSTIPPVPVPAVAAQVDPLQPLQQPVV